MPYKKTNPIKQLIEKGKMLSSAKGSSNYMKEDPGSPMPMYGGKKGDGPVYNLSGKKGLQPSNNPAAAYMTGSPAKHKMGGALGREVKHSHNNKASGDSSVSRQPQPLSAEEKSYFDTSNLPTKKQRLANEAKNKIKPTLPKPSSDKNNKKTTLVKKKQTPKSTPEDNTPSAAQTAASKLEQRAKTAISKRKKAPKTKDGVNAVIEHQNKKKAASKIKDTKTKSKAEIRSAKTTAKQAGKSKQEIRLAKTKAKAKNARIETTSKETAAQGGKKAQEKRAKTIRLEKRAKRIEARIAKRKAKK